MKRYLMIVAIGLIALIGLACSGDDDDASPAPNACGGAVASCSGDFDTPAPVEAAAGALLFPDVEQHGPTLGNDSAPLKVDLWVNFLCPHCSEFMYSVLPQVVTNYVAKDKVQLTFRNAAIGPETAITAHEAAACANDQDKFWQAVDAMYFNYSDDDNDYAADKIPDRLAGADLDVSSVGDCLTSHTHQAAIDSDVSAFHALNAQQLPVLVVDGTKYEALSDYSQVQTILDRALSSATATGR